MQGQSRRRPLFFITIHPERKIALNVVQHAAICLCFAWWRLANARFSQSGIVLQSLPSPFSEIFLNSHILTVSRNFIAMAAELDPVNVKISLSCYMCML